jgi:hypothetical protein
LTGKGSIDAGGFGAFLKSRDGAERTSAIMPDNTLDNDHGGFGSL